MRQVILPFILGAVLAACAPEGVKVTAIVGGHLVQGDGSTVEESVVIVDRGLIRSAGSRVHVPIPAHSDKIDASGSFVVAARSQDGRIALAPALALRPGGAANLAVVANDPRHGTPRIQRLMLEGRWTQANADMQ